MSRNPDGLRASFIGMRPYVCTAAAVVISYIVFSLLLKAGEAAVRALMLAGVLLCGVYYVVRSRGRDSGSRAETLISAIIAAGMVMRIGYMLYTSFTMGGTTSCAGDDGHFGYMYQLFATGSCRRPTPTSSITRRWRTSCMRSWCGVFVV